jgi:hypothetical protein
MSHIGYWKAGDNNATCDRCGKPFKASELKRTWDNLYVCARDWEPRHPQDYVKGVKDTQSVELNRDAWLTDTFTAEADALPMPPNPLGV